MPLMLWLRPMVSSVSPAAMDLGFPGLLRVAFDRDLAVIVPFLPRTVSSGRQHAGERDSDRTSRGKIPSEASLGICQHRRKAVVRIATYVALDLDFRKWRSLGSHHAASCNSPRLENDCWLGFSRLRRELEQFCQAA